jgi:hypothetical protein
MDSTKQSKAIEEFARTGRGCPSSNPLKRHGKKSV